MNIRINALLSACAASGLMLISCLCARAAAPGPTDSTNVRFVDASVLPVYMTMFLSGKA